MKYVLLLWLFAVPAFAASSETIIPPTDAKTVSCQKRLEDHIIIAQHMAGGWPQNKLEEKAKVALDKKVLTSKHFKSVIKLIREAYVAKDYTIWLNSYWVPCMNEK